MVWFLPAVNCRRRKRVKWEKDIEEKERQPAVAALPVVPASWEAEGASLPGRIAKTSPLKKKKISPGTGGSRLAIPCFRAMGVDHLRSGLERPG